MTHLDELLIAKEAVKNARLALANIDRHELYSVRISTPEKLYARQSAVNKATYELIDALNLLAWDLDEEIKDASN